MKELARYAPEGLAAPRVAFAEARELMRAKLGQLGGRPEGGGGIRVSTAMPMRAVPFRAVFVMGLAEGLFPATDRAEPLDLRQRAENRRASDLGRAEQDRYLFLEQLLSARDALRLSYPSADPLTGDARPRSSVLEELLEIVEAMTGGATPIFEEHPLRRFDAAYFAPGSPLRSLSPGAAAEARALVSGERPVLPSLPLPLPEAEPQKAPLRLSLAQLHAWLLEPAEGLAKARLGLRGEEEDEAALDQEAVVPEAFDASRLEREVLAARLEGGHPVTALEEAWRALELKGRVPLGALGSAAKRASWERIETWKAALPGGIHRVHRFGPGDQAGDEVHDALRIEASVGGRAVQVSLEGRTAFVHADHLAEVDRGKAPGAERRLARQLRLLVDQTALAAAGCPSPGRFLIVDGEGKITARDVPAPGAEAANARLRAWIEALLRDGLGPIHRLPAAYARAKRVMEPGRWIELQDRRREPWSVLPGSVLRGLPAPDREAAMGELAFRLGPLMEPEDAP
jgi:exodeoxyribonuclease V gamma subunit